MLCLNIWQHFLQIIFYKLHTTPVKYTNVCREKHLVEWCINDSVSTNKLLILVISFDSTREILGGEKHPDENETNLNIQRSLPSLILHRCFQLELNLLLQRVRVCAFCAFLPFTNNRLRSIPNPSTKDPSLCQLEM